MGIEKFRAEKIPGVPRKHVVFKKEKMHIRGLLVLFSEKDDKISPLLANRTLK